MKSIMAAFTCIMLLSACEGPQGSMGPRGPQGPEGTVNYLVLSGTVSNGLYETDTEGDSYVAIYNNSLRDDVITQLYLSRDTSTYAWLADVNWQLTNGAADIIDPDKSYLGYDYMIMMALVSE